MLHKQGIPRQMCRVCSETPAVPWGKYVLWFHPLLLQTSPPHWQDSRLLCNTSKEVVNLYMHTAGWDWDMDRLTDRVKSEHDERKYFRCWKYCTPCTSVQVWRSILTVQQKHKKTACTAGVPQGLFSQWIGLMQSFQLHPLKTTHTAYNTSGHTDIK